MCPCGALRTVKWPTYLPADWVSAQIGNFPLSVALVHIVTEAGAPKLCKVMLQRTRFTGFQGVESRTLAPEVG